MKTNFLLLLFISMVLGFAVPSSYAQDNWADPAPAGQLPSNFAPYFSPTMCTLGSDKVLYFGPEVTLVYDLSDNTWTNMNPATGPSLRVGFVMSYIGDDKGLLFGGSNDFDNGTPNLNDTWIYDLSDNAWNLLQPVTSPAPHVQAAIAFAGGHRAVMFGGVGSPDETWTFDLNANTWTVQSPSPNPGSQFNHAMASLDGDRVILFSGPASGSLTWVYDFSDQIWTQQAPINEPSWRYSPCMASLGGDRVLLFGGSYYDDTWIYDYGDDNWTEIFPSFLPPGSMFDGIASVGYDQVLMVQNFSNPTYLFTASPEPCPTEICNGIDDDCDGLIDEGVKNTYFLDNDNDGFGNPASSIQACEQPNGYVGSGTDCNDNNPTIYPDAPELPDGQDNDCDGLIDEGINAMNVEAGNCVVVYKGYAPAQCATLTVSVTGGTSPYTYLWSTGATTQSINVCPATTTTYGVTVTDLNSSTARDKVTVQVIDVRCGNNNDKVVLCHLNGNGTQQTLCVASSAVETHLSHGDFLGACDVVNPCNAEEQGYVNLTNAGTFISEFDVDMVTSDRTDAVQNNAFSLTPNPADQSVLIKLKGEIQEVTFTLFDVSGRVLQHKEMKGNELDLSTVMLNNGVYYVQLVSAEFKCMKSLVIVH